MRPVRSRIFLSSLIISVVLAVGMWPAAAAATTASPGMSAAEIAQRSTPVGAAITALTGDNPDTTLAVLPADFATVLDYEPESVDGMPRNPTGECSSPIPLPTRFENLCKTHDFGYDLLRYADRTGQPLGPWARTSLDHMLVDLMHTSCSDPTCHWAADLARIGLAFNTWRQHAGAPVKKESLTAIMLSTAVRGGESLASLVGL